MNTSLELAPEWNKARREARGRKSSAVAANIFSGASKIEAAEIDGVQVLRLSVTPEPNKPIPASMSVNSQADWKSMDRLLPYSMTWQQSCPARYDFQFQLPEAVRCLGLGERYSGLNLRGRVHTLFTTDDTHHTESSDPLYKAIPLGLFLQGDECTGFFLDSPAPQRWDLDSEQECIGKIELFSRLGFRLYVLGPAPVPQVVQAYTSLTGRSSLPPRWSLGHQQCRWSYPDEKTVAAIAHEFRARSIPCDAIVLDIDYMDEYRVFTHSPQRFPHFAELIEKLSGENFKVITIVDPGIKQDPKYNLFQEGQEKELFCKTTDGKLFVDKVWPGLSVFPDFLKEDTRKWWGDLHRFYTSSGIAGIWNDMNEPAFFSNKKPWPQNVEELPPESEQYFQQELEGASVGHFEVRNLYGMMMSRATHEGLCRLKPDERPFVLTRAAYAGIQRFAAVWLGDNMSWWEHLGKSIPMLLNVGLSGVPFAGVDVGGFGGDTTAELLVRWYELGIFYPFFRNHCIMQGRAQEPWAFNGKVEDAIRRLIETRYRLLPYIQNLFWEHTRSGAPLMRPLLWHYPDDTNAAEIDSQFLFGRDILVAPILEAGKTHRAVYFPAGRWYPIEGGAPLSAGLQMVEIQLGSVPAFVAEGSIIPYLSPVQHTGDYNRAAVCFTVYGSQARGTFFEDDGSSNRYLDGEYNEWSLDYAQGKFQATPLHRGYQSPWLSYKLLCDGLESEVRLA